MKNEQAIRPATNIVRICIVIIGIILLLTGLRSMMADLDALIHDNGRAQNGPSVMLRLPVERVFLDQEEDGQSSRPGSGQDDEGAEETAEAEEAAEDETLAEVTSPSEQVLDQDLPDAEFLKKSVDQEPSDEITDDQSDASPAAMPRPVHDATPEIDETDAAEHSYFVQVGSYHVQSNAENSASRLREKTYPAQVRTMVLNGQTWHFVFAHGFTHEQAAHAWAARFREKEQRDAVVVHMAPSRYRVLWENGK
ncbi:SPOR domain-containing protein [Desulfonatronum parangueonense]